MRTLRHQPTIIWIVTVALAALFAVAGLASDRNPDPSAAMMPADGGRVDAQAMLDHLPSVHVALELGQASAWADATAEEARAARDRYAAWGDAAIIARWDDVVAAADALTGADPDTDRAVFLALASQLDARTIALVAAL